MEFDTLVESLLSEQAWDFDAKKVFYVLRKGDFVEKLREIKKADPVLLPSGFLPAKKPMYQMGALSGKISDSQIWASTLLSYYNDHGQPMKPKEILKKAQVRPNDNSLFNFYKDVQEHLGEFVVFEMPGKAFEL